MTNDYFDIILSRKGMRLRLKGKIKQSGDLKSPFEGAMTATIKEGLAGEIKVVMKDKYHQVLLASKSYSCGIEIEV